MSEREDVIAVNRDFYRAFESLELDRMEAVWLRDPKIICIHPGWRKLEGWGPVMQSWERIFQSAFEMEFDVREIEVMVGRDLAVVVTEENLAQKTYDGIARSQVLATNVYEKVGLKWLMVLHHGSPVMQPSSEEEPPLQ